MDEINAETKNGAAEIIEKIPIKINIAERIYSFRIDKNDEEKIRNAAKQIKEKVMYYRQRYADRDAQDALSMATLQFVLKLNEVEKSNDLQPIQNDVNDLNERLESYLLSEEKK